MKDNRKLLGVLGGMGPLASQLFYKKTIEKTHAEHDQEHINLILLSHASIMDRTEAIMCGTTDELLAQLEHDLDVFQHAGVDYCVITCNTCHVLLDRLREYCEFEIISMPDTVAEYLHQQHGEGTKIGIMATDGTVKMGIYHTACEKYGLVPVDVCPESQKTVMDIIYNYVKKGKTARLEDFEIIRKELEAVGCEKIILGCTELSCVKDDPGLPDFYVDPMDVLAEKAVELCGGNLNRE